MPSITLAQAGAVADAALHLAHALETPVRITVAVVDEFGAPVLVLRDGAGWLTPDVARAKAATAARMACTTESLGAKRETYPDWWEQLLRRLPEATTLGGGIPLVVDGTVIGAVGVSGGTVPQDIELASAGAAALRI